jgi:UDP-N-acetylmuramoylalanine--D-glutamate ligase
VVGLARSGEAVARVLRERGERVIGADGGRSPALEAAAERLSRIGVEVQLDASDDAIAASAGTLVKSPGVPDSAPIVRGARARGIPVLGELELAWRLLPNEFIAVTGTNGKTTTTEWIGHIHRVAGAPVAVAGNVGTALSTLVDTVDPAATIVCEASSFQLEDTEAFAPEVALLLNLEPDHLDRHGTFEAYRAAKLRIFASQTSSDLAVVPPEFPVDPDVRARVLRFGAGPELALADEIGLPGAHNRLNGMAAACVCLARGLPVEAVAEGLRTFGGVVHRLELVAERGGVRWVNDSKATNVASTVVALQSFPAGVHLIAGGQGKGQDFSPLAPLVASRCRAVYLIGEDGPVIADAVAGEAAAAGVALVFAGTLEHAVTVAGRAAAPGEVVLLSPACASYDQFTNFEVRGDAFRALATQVGA